MSLSSPECFTEMRCGLHPREEILFHGIDTIYWQLFEIKNSDRLRELVSDHLIKFDRDKLYFVMYQVCIVAGRWIDLQENPEGGRQAFENLGMSIELKRMALVRFAFIERLIERDYPGFDEKFAKGIEQKAQQEAAQIKHDSSISSFLKSLVTRKQFLADVPDKT